MLKLKMLSERAQFDALKKGDTVFVEWHVRATEHRKGKPFTINKIYGINENDEIILNARTNSYFNIEMYLARKSTAKAAYIIEQI